MNDRTEGIVRQAQELIEQAYQRGFKEGYEEGKGQAWEAARKLVSADYKECNEILGYNVLMDDEIFAKCTASEAIEKIKAYEERKKQDNKIHVGDEVTYTFHNGRSITPFVVFSIECLADGGKYYTGLETSTMKCVCGGLDYVKTGRHFPEIAEVLKKLKESE